MAIGVMENSRMWLTAAQLSLGKGIYTIALYSAEMATEMALKGVLQALKTDVPKAHNITAQIRAILEANGNRLPKEFLDNESLILGTFRALVDLRPQVGYIHEGKIDEKRIESQAKEYVKNAGYIVRLCDKAIAYIGKGQK